MTRTVLAVLALAAACFSERTRPAPPAISIVFNTGPIHSPGSLTGSVHASDPDGMDSVWLTVDAVPAQKWDATLETDFNATFLAPISSGRPVGFRIPIQVTARDVAGFTGELDTAVTVN